jgi:hypothetical protein
MNEWIIIIDLMVSWELGSDSLRGTLQQAGFAVSVAQVGGHMTLTYRATHDSEHAMMMFVLAKGNALRAFKYKKVTDNHE